MNSSPNATKIVGFIPAPDSRTGALALLVDEVDGEVGALFERPLTNARRNDVFAAIVDLDVPFVSTGGVYSPLWSVVFGERVDLDALDAAIDRRSAARLEETDFAAVVF